MKTVRFTLAILAALAPSLALGFGIDSPTGPIIVDPSGGISIQTPVMIDSSALNDALNDAMNPTIQNDALKDSLADALNNPSGGGVISPVQPLPMTGIPGGNGNGKSPQSGSIRDAKAQIAKSLKCFVMGTPSEFPDDLRIRNASAVSLPPGTELHWRVKASGDDGYAVLDRVLRPGQTLRLNNVLADGIEAGTVCVARIT